MDSEAIMDALFTLCRGAASFVNADRRLRHWSEVASQPAIFIEDAPMLIEQMGGAFPPKRTLCAKIWIYTKTDPEAAPSAALNPLVDSVQRALFAPPGQRQTLGGIVYHAWIEGFPDCEHVAKDDGHLDTQAIAQIPVRVLVP